MSAQNGLKHTVKTVTPRMAADYIANMIPNRPRRPKDIRKYAAAMREGRWHLTGDPLRFTKDDQMWDGQHRCLACMEANTPFKTLVVRGLDPEHAIHYVDNQVKRTGKDMLHFFGHKNTSVLASAALVFHQIMDGQGERTGLYKNRCDGFLTDHQVLHDYVEEHMEFFNLGVNIAVEHRKEITGWFPASIVAGGIAAFAKAESLEWAKEFGEAFCTGADLATDSPIRKVRQILVRKAMDKKSETPKFIKLNLFCRCWNAFITDHQASRGTFAITRVAPGEMIPKLLKAGDKHVTTYMKRDARGQREARKAKK